MKKTTILSLAVVLILIIGIGLFAQDYYSKQIFIDDYNKTLSENKTYFNKISEELDKLVKLTNFNQVQNSKLSENISLKNLDEAKYNLKFSKVITNYNQSVKESNQYLTETAKFIDNLNCYHGEFTNIENILSESNKKSEEFKQNSSPNEAQLISFFDYQKEVFANASLIDKKINECVDIKSQIDTNPYKLLSIEYQNMVDGVRTNNITKVENAGTNIQKLQQNLSVMVDAEVNISLKEKTNNLIKESERITDLIDKASKENIEELKKLGIETVE